MHVLTVILLFSSLYTAQTKSNEKEHASNYATTKIRCARKVGVTLEFVETNFQKDFKGDVDEKFKCVLACIYENEIKLKDDGSLDIESTRINIGKGSKISDRNEVMKAVQACSNIKGDNDCDTIFKIVTCAMKHLDRRR